MCLYVRSGEKEGRWKMERRKLENEKDSDLLVALPATKT